MLILGLVCFFAGGVLRNSAKMNDLMTSSFLSYVELKKQAQKDLEDVDLDIEAWNLNPTEDPNLSQFFREMEAIKVETEEIRDVHVSSTILGFKLGLNGG